MLLQPGCCNQRSAKMHASCPKMHWGWESSCCWVDAILCKNACIAPQNVHGGWVLSCTWVNATLCKNARITPKTAFGGGRAPASRLMQPFTKMHISPPKIAGGGRGESSPMPGSMQCFAKTRASPQKLHGGGFLYPTPQPRWVLWSSQPPPPQCKTASQGVGACALLLIAGFKPKKGREKVEKTDFGGQNSLSACNTVASSLPPPPPAQGSHP